MYIKMYVTEEEKKQLEQIAQRRKIPLSKLCYEQVIPLLHNPMKDSIIYLPNQTDYEKCTHSVTLHLSDSEYDTLMKKANGSPLSRYIRNILLHHSESIHIEVYTEDISILTMKVSGYIQNLYNFIAALAIRRQLYEADYNHLIQIANDTQKALRDVANYVKANRSSIRATGVRILRKEIKKGCGKADAIINNGKYTKHYKTFRYIAYQYKNEDSHTLQYTLSSLLPLFKTHYFHIYLEIYLFH